MTDDTAVPRSNLWLRCLAAGTLLAIGYIAFQAWTATPAAKVAFAMTAGIDDRRIRIGGAAGIADGAFGFDGNRISFSGRIDGDKVVVDGRIVSGDRTRTKPFKGSGTIVDGRVTVTVRSSDGNRVGALQLDFDPA